MQSQALEELKTLTASFVLPTREPLNASFLDEKALLRFLKARDFNVQDAYNMWCKWVAWRIEYKADEITETEVKKEIETGKAYWYKHDKQGRPCLIVRPARHHPSQREVRETMRFAIYLLEEGIKRAEESGVDQVVVLFDRKGVSVKNFDRSLFGMMKELSGMLQAYYAERLACFYVLHVNWIYWTLYKIVSPFLNKRTKEKIKILKHPSDLLNYFDIECLEEEHSGRISLPPLPASSNRYVHSEDDASVSERPTV
eukprot:GILK01006244.1.p1 GENE.GILK01006244.1~~GILK01006244.1.p1  ORF type:complete len:256 (+),score=43.00 GILK01006244.1:53-820(+)